MANVYDDVLIGAPDRDTADANTVGYGYVLPRAAVLPTSTTATLPVGATDLGFISEDGISISTDRSSEPIKDWNLDEIRLLLTEHSSVVKLVLISWSIGALHAYFGEDNVDDGVDEVTIRINAKEIPDRPFMFRMKDQGRKRLVVIPRAAIESQGEIVLSKQEATPLELELKALADTAGEKIYIYTAKPPVTP